MNTPEKKWNEYLIRAERRQVRICGTSPYKLMNKRNDPMNAVNMEEERVEVQSVESDELNVHENTVRNGNVEMEQMRLENAALKVANRRLKKHIIKMHSRNAGSKRAASTGAVDAGAANTVVDKIGYSCEMCGRQFTFKSAMTRHVNGIHLKKTPHKCIACPYTSYQSTNVRSHMIMKHGIVHKTKPNNSQRYVKDSHFIAIVIFNRSIIV